MRAQDYAFNSIAPSAGYQPINNTADARRAASVPDKLKHYNSHIASRQMRV
jgi:hypothetical protein